MNKRELFQTISLLDDDLIAEAETCGHKVRRFRVSKIAAVAAAALLLLGASVWAGNVILSGRGGHSTNIPTYTAAPDAEQLAQDIGISPDIPRQFTNGYVFDAGYIVYNEDYGTDGEVFEQFRGLQCTYEKNGEKLELYIDGALAGNQITDTQITETYQGTEISYDSYTGKMVPPDYQMTEQDIADERSGKYVFSYGSPEVRITRFQMLFWEYRGLNYTMTAADSAITPAEMMQTAKEMIDAQQGEG